MKSENTSAITTASCGLVRENEDGSAVYWFEFTEEQKEALIRLGIISAIKAGLAEAEQYKDDYNAKTTRS